MRRATTRDRCTAHCHRWAELSSPRAPPPPCSGHEQVDAFTRCVGEICEERTAAQPARATAQVRAWSHRGAIRGRRPVVAVFSLRRGSAHTPFSRHSKYHVRRPRRSRLVISEKPGVKLAPQEVPRTCRIPDGALSHSPDMVVRAAAVAISSSVSTPLARPDPAPTRFFNRLTAVAALVGGGRDGSADGARRGGRGVGGCVVVAPGALLAPRRRQVGREVHVRQAG